MNRPRPATAAARPSSNSTLATGQTGGADASHSFVSTLGASKAFPMTREVYTTNMNIGLPTVKQKNMSESLRRMLDRPRSSGGATSGKSKHDPQQTSTSSVSFGSRPSTATIRRKASASDNSSVDLNSSLITPLFSAYGVTPKDAIPSFAPTQFLQRPISAQRTIIRPPSALSMSSFASSKRLPSASSTRQPDSPSAPTRGSASGVYSDSRQPDHAGVGAAKLVDLTQKIVMKRMQNVLADVDEVQWQSSRDSFQVDLPITSSASNPAASGINSAAPQPWMRLHGNTEEIIVKLEWSGAAPAVSDGVRSSLIQSLGESAAVAKLHDLCSDRRSNVADVDLSIIMLDDKLAVMDVVYYNNLSSRDYSLLHGGDSNQTGSCCESAVVSLSSVSPNVHAIAFGINLHGTVPPCSQQQRAVSSEGRPSSAHAPKSDLRADASANLDSLTASDVLWVPEKCCLRVFSTTHSFLLASYNISFVASDDVWNPKLTRRPMSGGGRLRMMSKSSSLDDLADCDADVQMVADSDGDAAWDELDAKNESGVSDSPPRAARFLGSSLRRSIHETRVSSSKGPSSEPDSNAAAGDPGKDLVQQVSFAANEAETATVKYIDWISFIDSCDATGNLHVSRETCLTAFRSTSAAMAVSSSAETEGSVSTHPLRLNHFATMLQQTLLPIVRQAESKLPTPSTLRCGIEAMCSALGVDSRQPLSERVIDIACVQRGANVFCLHRGNQSSSFAASVAAEHRTAGKNAFSVERSWFLQTLGSVTLAVNLVQNLASLRELLVDSGVFIPVIVAVEYCTAERPSVSLRGKTSDFSDRFESLKARVERSLPFVKVEANPTWMLPGGPRISAFEVFFQDPSNMNCICIHSKAESKCWPNVSEVITKLQRLIQSREKMYKLPVDLCPVRLTCQSAFQHAQPLVAAPVHIHRIGDEYEIADICSIAGAPPAQSHTLCHWQGPGVDQFVSSDAATLCVSGRTSVDGTFSTRLSAGVYVAAIGGDDMIHENVLLIIRTLQKAAVAVTVTVKPRLYRLSGRVINGSKGDPVTHGHVAIKSAAGGSEDIIVDLVHHINPDAKNPVPQLPISLVPQPDTFSESSGSRTSASVSNRASEEPLPAQGGSAAPAVPSASRSLSNAAASPPPDVIEHSTVSDTIFAVVNSEMDDFAFSDGLSKSRALSNKIKQMSGTFEVMLPQGDYVLSVNVAGFSAGGVFQVNIRRGALHLGVIAVHPDSDLLLLNNLRDLRSKKRFNMQGVLSANMDAVSAVLAQATATDAAKSAAAADAAAAKKRVLRSKVSRNSESLPASFVSSYQLSVPLILLRGSGVSADKTGKISIRHQSHRFPSLSLPPSSCKPGFDAPAVDKLPACKSKAAHIARHILCGASYDVCEQRCTLDSRALSDSPDLHRSPVTLVVEVNAPSSKNDGTYLKVGSGGRLAAIAGLPVAFTLQINDRCMCACLNALETAVNCSVRFGNSELPITVVPACDIGFGLHVISFVPPMNCPGVYTVSCTVNGSQVEGSPFSVTVAPYEPAVTTCSRLLPQPAHPCLPWPHCLPADGNAPPPPTVVVTQNAPGLVASGWYAPFELYNDETARWVGSSSAVGDTDVVLVIEICQQNQQLVDALRHCSDTLVAGLLQLDLCTSLSVGLVLYTFSPPSSEEFEPVQVHGPCSSDDAAAMVQSALSSESFVGRALELESNRNLLPGTPTNVDAALAAVAAYAWRPLAARTAIIFPRNTPPGLDIHHMPDVPCAASNLRWWQACEKLRSMSVELHAIRTVSPYPYGPVSSSKFQEAGYPFSASFKGRSSETIDVKALAAIDEVAQAVKTWHIAANNPKLISAVSDSHRTLAITAQAAYSAAADACFTVQTQQTGGVFLKVSDVPNALAALPQLVAQSLDMRLFTEALINEAVAHREQLLLIPNVANRKQLLLQLLHRNNVTLRRIFFVRDLAGKAALRPSLATLEAVELALSHLKGEYRKLLLDQAPMLNKLDIAHRRGSAFALAVELIELGLL